MRFESAFVNRLLVAAVDAEDKCSRALHNKIALQHKQYCLTYDKLRKAVGIIAEQLSEAGVASGMVVAISKEILPADYIVVLLAIIEIKAMPCLQDNVEMLRANDILHVCISKQINNGQSMQSRYIEWIDAYVNIYSREINRQMEAGSILLASSGSTSEPKIIIQSLQGILTNIKSNATALSISPEEKSLCILPVYYSYGLIGQVFTHLYCGATVVFESCNSLLLNVRSVLKEHKITNVFFVPAILRQVLLFARRHSISGTEHPLNFITSGGAFIDCTTMKEAVAFFKCNLVKTYGLAEAGPRVSTKIFKKDDPVITNNLGTPLVTTRIEIVNDHLESLPDQAIGNVVIHSSSVCRGYLGYAHQNIVPETKIVTKDVGFIKHGELYVLGREDDFVYWSGQKIWFNAILEVLYATLCFYKIEIVKQQDQLMIALFPVSGCTLSGNDIKTMLEKNLQVAIEDEDIAIKYPKFPRTFK